MTLNDGFSLNPRLDAFACKKARDEEGERGAEGRAIPDRKETWNESEHRAAGERKKRARDHEHGRCRIDEREDDHADNSLDPRHWH